MTETDLDRRQFLRAAAGGCAALFAGGPGFRAGWRTDVLRVGFVGLAEGWTAARGVGMGVEEAARTGQLVGRAIELRSVLPGDAESLVRDPSVAAVIGGEDEEACRALAALAEASGILFINVGCRSDALRQGCAPGVFHVEASERMYAGALAAGVEGAAAAALWHPSLERFGAEQLNARFRARFGGEMDGPAWAGWMAVKALWEASLRARTTEAAALRGHLERPATQFDGHKGWPLSFRARDHQLRQPLYLLADGGSRVVGEVPARPAEGGGSLAEQLDRLGAGDAP